MEGMRIRAFNLNIARAFIGRHVNLHLKDGSVLVNILIAEAKREEESGKAAIFYVTKQKDSNSRIVLKDVSWMEQVNPHLL
jgi:hypothetical protein